MIGRRKCIWTTLIVLSMIIPVMTISAIQNDTQADVVILKEETTFKTWITIRTRMLTSHDPLSPISIQPISTSIIGGGISIGFSDGGDWEEVVDPTPGTPMVPWLATSLTVRGDIISVDTKTSDIRSTEVGSAFKTMPEAVTPWEEQDPFHPWVKGIAYPVERHRLSHAGYRRQSGELLHIYSLWISPAVLTGSGDVEHSENMEVEIEWSGEMSEPAPTRSEGDPLNVPGTLSISSNLDVNPIYLIVTSSDLGERLVPLSNWRNQLGTATSIVSIEDILEEYQGPGDDADRLRDYLRDVRDEWGALEFVLLAGDWDKVPTKRVVDSDAYAGWDDGFIPADSYFSCLDGTWDLDGDGQYAEVGDMEDIIPDLYVSRLAINDPDVWEGKIQQLIDYEIGMNDNNWGENAILAAAHTHNEGDGTVHSNYLWDKYLSSAYERKSELYESLDNLSASILDDAIQSGGGIIQFVDHGGPTVWCDNYGAGVVYRDRDARDLTNGPMLPVISTLACLTTWFDDTSGCPSQRFSDCLGEAFTENVNGGAIGYIGSSRTSVGILGANRYLPYDNGLQEDYARQVGGLNEYNLGRSFTDAKGHYAEMWAGQFNNVNNAEVSMCWLEYTLLGEPATDIWTENEGLLVVNVQHENDLDPYIIVTVENDNGEPVTDANVTLQNFQRGVFSLGTTDENGKAGFELELDWFCDINLTVRKQNHNPHLGYVRISDIIPPITTMEVEDDPMIGTWYRKEVNITLTPNEKGVVHYRIDDGPYRETNSSLNYSIPALGEGLHHLHFFAEDIAGNLEEEAHVDIGMDLADPITVITPSPKDPTGENGWYDTDPLISLTGRKDDRGSPVIYHYTIDNGPDTVYSEGFLIREGEHQIRAWAEDLSGRSSNVSELKIKVDTTPPTCTITLSPESPDGEGGWYRTKPKLNLSTSEGDARIEYKLSQADDFRPYTGDLKVPDGRSDIHFRSIDRSGNIGKTYSHPIMVDSSPPKIFCRTSPSTPDGSDDWFITPPVLHFTWEDNNEALILHRMDRGEWVTSSGWLDIPDGEHRVDIKAVDQAGHESDIETIDLKVDTKTPTTEVDVVGNRVGDWFRSMPVITLTNDEDHIVRYRWNGADYLDYDLPFEPTGREGFFTLEIYSMDMAGNREPTQRFTFQVDTEAPSISASVRDIGGGRRSITLSDTKDGSSNIMFRLSERERVLTDWTGRYVIELELSRGTHIITIEARDEAGNIGKSSITIEVNGGSIHPAVVVVIGAISTLAAAAYILLSRRGKPDHERSDLYRSASHGNIDEEQHFHHHTVKAEIVEIIDRRGIEDH